MPDSLSLEPTPACAPAFLDCERLDVYRVALYVRARIEEGLHAADKRRVVPHEEVKRADGRVAARAR